RLGLRLPLLLRQPVRLLAVRLELRLAGDLLGIALAVLLRLGVSLASSLLQPLLEFESARIVLPPLLGEQVRRVSSLSRSLPHRPQAARARVHGSGLHLRHGCTSFREVIFALCQAIRKLLGHLLEVTTPNLVALAVPQSRGPPSTALHALHVQNDDVDRVFLLQRRRPRQDGSFIAARR